ncbi:MAG TPA: TonB-dependent receptor, partial [Steroidobacteraceae bacterium]|nr:TonB-dependent receptor [Steroidobacteraceae bacterium]
AKAFDQDGNRDYLGGEAHDTWRQARIGGRTDIDLDDGRVLQISAEAYRGSSGMDVWDYSALPNLVTFPARDEFNGAFATAEWSATGQAYAHIALRGIADYTNRDSIIFDERRNTYELELQHNLPTIGRHQAIWGLGARYTYDVAGQSSIGVYPNSESLAILNGFAQDDMAFLNDALHVIAGGKIEHSEYIGTQFMPSLRVRYNESERTMFWAAVSRGVRSASRLERDVRVTDLLPTLPPFSPFNPTPAPLGVEIWGDPNFRAEKLQAFEFGLRSRLADAFSIDVATYYNKYEDIRGVKLLPPLCSPSMTPLATDPLCVFTATKIVVPMQYTNLLSGHTWGAELTATWNPARQWRLIGSYAYLDHSFQENPVDFGIFQLDFAKLAEGLDARNQWTLRSNLSIGAKWDWDVTLRHVDALPTSEAPAYTEANTRIAWRPRMGFELALVGENLLRPDHREFVSDFVDLSPVSIKRSVRVQARWSF